MLVPARAILFVVSCLTSLAVAASSAEGFGGSLGAELRGFAESPVSEQQAGQRAQFSIALQPEYYTSWEGGRQNFGLSLFARLDSVDQERTHADLRELWWRRRSGDYEWRAGVGKVYWGVMESVHLADVINQSDAVEDFDGEDKLGQPMLSVGWRPGVVPGNFDFFLMPLFRERTFPGEEGRLRPFLPVDADQPSYESDHGEHHVDAALRYSGSLDGWDLGLSYFQGTSRDPRFLLVFDQVGIVADNPPLACRLATSPNLAVLAAALLPALVPACEGYYRVSLIDPTLQPAYDQMLQAGLELQHVMEEGSLLKLEAVYRDTRLQSHYALAAGFEYTWAGIFDTSLDATVVLEYLYDSRGSVDPDSDEALALRTLARGETFSVMDARRLAELELRSYSPFQDDVFAGTRVAVNDAASTEFLMGVIVDRDSRALLFNFEGSRRLGQDWRLEAEMRAFANIPLLDPLYSYRQDSHVRLVLTRYF